MNGKIILSAIVGSHAYGLADKDSDEDILGIYVAPTIDILALKKPTESVVDTDPDYAYHEVEKFIRLAMRCNPTILELLFLDKYLVKTREGEMIKEIRQAFLSKITYKSYGGYAISQARKLQKTGRYNKRLQKRFEKHTRHCFRLIQQGSQLLKTGGLDVKVSNREELLEIGRLSVDQIFEKFNKAFNEFNKIETSLPDKPDYQLINRVLLTIREKN